MSEEPLQIQHNEQENLPKMRFHPFSDLLGFSQKIYNQIPLIHISPIENTVKKMNLDKLSQFIDKHFDQTISLIIPVKDKVVQSGQNIRENLVQNSKISTLVKKADSISGVVMDHLENQVQFLETLVKNHCQGNGEGHEQQLQSELKNSEESHEKSDLVNITDRTKKLAERVNSVSVLLAQASFGYLRSFKLIDQLCKLYLALNNSSSNYLFKIKAHSLVIQDMTFELTNAYIHQPYIRPSIIFVQSKYIEKKEQVIIVVQNVKKVADLVQWKKIQEQYQTLEQSVVKFYKNTLKIEVLKQYLQQNYEKVHQEIQKAVQDIKNYEEKIQTQVVSVYNKALKEYQQRLEEKYVQRKAQLSSSQMFEIEGEQNHEDAKSSLKSKDQATSANSESEKKHSQDEDNQEDENL